MRILIVTVLLTPLIATQQAFSAPLSASDFKGRSKCGLIAYEWPKTAESLPMWKAKGTLWVEGDGKGNWTKGEMTLKMAASGACKFAVTNGRYEIKSDASLLSTITWRLLDGDPTTCNTVIGAYASQDTRKVESPVWTSSVPVYANEHGELFQLTFGSEGFGSGKCEPMAGK